MKKIIYLAFAIGLIFLGSTAQADPITGVELYDSFNAPSTNALNYAREVPGREGQAAPFVLFVSNDVGKVTLDFFNAYAGGAFFEYRIDHNVKMSGTDHPVVTGDFIYPGVWIDTPLASITRAFNATNIVEIRLALGGERDWDFDWTAFRVSSVPEPTTMVLIGLGLVGIVGMRRKLG